MELRVTVTPKTEFEFSQEKHTTTSSTYHITHDKTRGICPFFTTPPERTVLAGSIHLPAEKGEPLAQRLTRAPMTFFI